MLVKSRKRLYIVVSICKYWEVVLVSVSHELLELSSVGVHRQREDEVLVRGRK